MASLSRPGAWRFLEVALIVSGLGCLLWVLAGQLRATLYQQRIAAELAGPEVAGPLPRKLPGPMMNEGAGAGESVIGLLEIERIGLSVVVIEGDHEQALAVAAGHLPDTPLPWERGNSALAGHRTSFFRPLSGVQVGDSLSLSTRHGLFGYRVTRVLVTEPTDLSVLDQTSRTKLTLITCFPFRYIGSAPQRFIVQAERVEADVRSVAARDIPTAAP
jgi:LPXTG-site transpeptidase (sortase) family protein